jgi:hypothetical protein
LSYILRKISMLRGRPTKNLGGRTADGLNNFTNLIPPTDTTQHLRTLYGELNNTPHRFYSAPAE